MAFENTHSDEEALDQLLEQRQPAAAFNRRYVPGSVRKGLLVAVPLATGAAVALWSTSSGMTSEGQEAVTLPADGFQQKMEIVGATALEPHEAHEQNEKRQRLIIEQDMKTLLAIHTSRRQGHFRQQSGKEGPDLCHQQAERLFDDLVEESAMDVELNTKERVAFKGRFAKAMKSRCKDLVSERLWLEAAGTELEQQKPMITGAVAASINSAGMGFQVRMHDWLVHESMATFDGKLGMLSTSVDQKDVLKRKQDDGRQAANLPEVFRAELKWPKCREAILKIHNQGHCGSCWAFGGLASVDARMCIASDGKWDAPEDMLSRLHVTSCAPQNHWAGHDGCQGGFPHWPMEMMAKSGVASTSCLPYYISGEGTEHFEHQDVAPPCETHCQGGYSVPLKNDTFSSSGIANYDWLTHVWGGPFKIGKMKTAIYQEGPVAFAFRANRVFMGYKNGVFTYCGAHDQANHAVYAFGWGLAAHADGSRSVEYVEASNSWGTDWGADGHFRIHPRCVTDVVIPGTIENSVVGHLVGTVDPKVPRDPENERWPWPADHTVNHCPFKDGCLTDPEGAGNYTANEECVSHVLTGKTIKVVEFDMEYGYDVLYVNGEPFTGNAEYGVGLAKLDGMVVNATGIKFTSDFSNNRGGFKLCVDA